MGAGGGGEGRRGKAYLMDEERVGLRGKGFIDVRGRGMLTGSKGVRVAGEGGIGWGWGGHRGELNFYLPACPPDTAKATPHALNSSISEVYDADSTVWKLIKSLITDKTF